jgi:hypothetical protein
MMTLYFETVLAGVFNRNPHFLNLQDSTHPLGIYHVYTHEKQTGMEGGRRPTERRLERQQFTRWVKNTNMRECISSLLNLLKTCRNLHFQVNFKEKPTLRVLCLYSSIVSVYEELQFTYVQYNLRMSNMNLYI